MRGSTGFHHFRAPRPAPKPPTLDELVMVENHGSIVLLRPRTTAARLWLKRSTPTDAPWYRGALAVEPRHVDAILDGLAEEFGVEVAR